YLQRTKQLKELLDKTQEWLTNTPRRTNGNRAFFPTLGLAKNIIADFILNLSGNIALLSKEDQHSEVPYDFKDVVKDFQFLIKIRTGSGADVHFEFQRMRFPFTFEPDSGPFMINHLDSRLILDALAGLTANAVNNGVEAKDIHPDFRREA